jgi:hypothetical protein
MSDRSYRSRRNARGRTAAAGHPGTRPSRAAVLDPLEPRLLLTRVVNATDGDDMIRIDWVGSHSEYRVRVNNGPVIGYRDDEVVVNALGGNDTVQFGSLVNFNHNDQSIAVNLGEGDDYAVNVGRSLEDLELFVSLTGGGGNDTLALDGIDDLGTAFFVDAPTAGDRFTASVSHSDFSPSGTFACDATVESLDVVLGDRADEVTLRAKPAALRLSVAAGDGDDEFSVGGGDLDSNGWANTTLTGGAGRDAIDFDDRQDDYAPATEVETLSVGNPVVSKGTRVRIAATAFEEQEFFAADGAGGDVLGPGQVDFDALPGSVRTSRVNVGGNRETHVNVGAGDLTALAGRIELLFGYTQNAPVGHGTVSVNDQNATAPRTYGYYPGYVSAPVPVSISRPVPLTIRGGAGGDRFEVESVTTDAALTVRGGGGDDTFVLGQGDATATVLAPVAVFGEGGLGDVVEYRNEARAAFADSTLNGSSFVDGGRSHPLATVEGVRVFQPAAAGSRLAVRAAAGSLRVVGGGGPDAVVLGSATTPLATAVGAAVTFEGGGGDDELTLDDRLSNGSNTFTFSVDTAERFRFAASSATVTTAAVELRSLLSGAGPNTVTVNGTLSDVSIDTGDGNDTVSVPDATGLVKVDTGPEASTVNSGDVLSVNADHASAGDTPATVRLARNDKVRSLFVRPRGTLRIGAGAALLVSNDATVQGAVDLAGGALILDGPAAPTPAAATAWLTAGRANGVWNGTSPTDAGAIHSSLAGASAASDGVGFAPAADLFAAFPATFAGHAVTASAVLFRHTLAGDATLDQVVDFADLVVLAQNYEATGRFYFQCDFDYDGRTDFNDLVLLAQNYEASLAPLAALAARPVDQLTTGTTAASPALPPAARRPDVKAASATTHAAKPLRRPIARPADGWGD